MKKSILSLIPVLCMILWGCPKDYPDPEVVKEDRVSLLEKYNDAINIVFGPTGSNSAIDMTGFKKPECGVTNEFKNLKYTLVDDLPTDQYPCGSSSVVDQYLSLNPGTSLVIDVSYYSGIKTIQVNVVDGCTPGITVSLIDTEGNKIAEKVTSWGDTWAEFRTRNGLDFSKIKEIRVFKKCEGGPYKISISPF